MGFASACLCNLASGLHEAAGALDARGEKNLIPKPERPKANPQSPKPRPLPPQPCSFFFAKAFETTGLGERIANVFVAAMGQSSLGLAYGLMVAGEQRKGGGVRNRWA